MGSSKQQSPELNWIAVVVEDNGAVLREQCFECLLSERVRMQTCIGENHEVGDVDYAHAQIGGDFAKEGSSSNDFERHFDSKADENTG